jgi:DNA-binding MarR family transcriptional regulator
MAPKSEPRWLEPVEMRAWRGHLRMSWLVAAAIERDLRRAGLSHPDYYVLVQLSEAADHRMRMSDLADGIQWSKSRLSHHIDRMEQRDLVRREDCPSDARGAFACITAEGLRAIQAAAPGHVESIRRHFLDGLERDQLAMLGEVADIVIGRLAPERVTPEPAREGALDSR